MKTIVFPGSKGAYSEFAAQEFARMVEPSGTLVPTCAGTTFHETWKSVAEGQASLGVLPLRNSDAGWVTPTLELIADDVDRRVRLLGTTSVAIEHALLIAHMSDISNIVEVRSHPQALAQCSNYIARAGWATKEASNTAIAAQDVARLADPSVAAIAHPRCADGQPLVVAARKIQNAADNRTTFGLFAIASSTPPLDNDAPPSVVLVICAPPSSTEMQLRLQAAEVDAADAASVSTTKGQRWLVALRRPEFFTSLFADIGGEIVGRYEPLFFASVRASS